MSQLKLQCRSLLSVILLGGLVLSASSYADGDSKTKDWHTEVAHRAYPLAGVALANTLMRQNRDGTLADCRRTELGKAVAFGAVLAAGNEIAAAVVDSGLADTSNKAHAVAALPLLAFGIYKYRSDPVAAIPYIASGMSQLGQIVRRVILQNAEAITNLAKQQGFSEEHQGHALEVAKTTVAALGITTAILLLGSRDPTRSFPVSMVASSVFTLTYMARESLLEHHQISTLFGPFQVSLLLSTLGGVGMAFWNDLTVRTIAASALLEAGVFTGLETLISYWRKAGMGDVGAFIWQMAALTIGTLGYTKANEARSLSERIVRQTMQACLLPGALSFGLDYMKNYAASWRHQPENQS